MGIRLVWANFPDHSGVFGAWTRLFGQGVPEFSAKWRLRGRSSGAGNSGADTGTGLGVAGVAVELHVLQEV